MAAAVGKNLQRTVAGDNGAVEWFLMSTHPKQDEHDAPLEYSCSRSAGTDDSKYPSQVCI